MRFCLQNKNSKNGERNGYAIGIHGRKERMVIGIIGGGASGMAAALAAAENQAVQVILMERQTRVGRTP